MEIRAQEANRIAKTFLTIRADGRYLGTLFCLPDERDVIVSMLHFGGQALADDGDAFVHEHGGTK